MRGSRRDRVAVERDQDDDRRRDRADHLRDPVGDHVVHRHAAVEEHPERDRRVVVPARHLAECIEADEEREAEAERDRDHVEPPGAGRGEDRERADADEREGPETFREVPLHLPHADAPLSDGRRRSEVCRMGRPVSALDG